MKARLIRILVPTALVTALLALALLNGERLIAWFRSAPGVWAEAVLLDAGQRTIIDQYHQVLLVDFDTDLRVLTLKGQADVAQAAVREFAVRKVGNRSDTGRGLLLLIAPDIDVVRLEVSEALEPVFTDAFVAYIQQRQMVPFFQSGRIADGILATTELIYSRAVEAQKGEAFDHRKFEAISSGGGSQTAAGIGKGFNPDTPRRNESIQAGNSPADTMKAYLKAMSNRDSRPELPIYSRATRKMLAGWTVTPAQMDNIVRTFKKCGEPELRHPLDTQRAVLRYPVNDRTCAPWFLVREEDEWRLDLTMMQQAIRFNNRNEWHFAPGVSHPYETAFHDLHLDKNGFPHERPRQRWALSLQTRSIDGLNQTRVTYVGLGSAAERMGFQVGDRLLQWEGMDVIYAGQVSKSLATVAEGKVVTALIERDGQQMTLRMEAPPIPD